MKKRVLALLLIVCLSLGVPGTLAAEVERAETVYVTLANDGQVQEVRVVNWLRGNSEQPEWVDYGSYKSIENSVSSTKPQVDQGMIKWPAALLQGSGLFYQGVAEKALPFSIKLSYWLEGKQIEPAKLAGKSGRVTIKIATKNLMRHELNLKYSSYQGSVQQSKEILYTPLMMQIGITLPVSIWSEIDAASANQVMVGDKLKLNWALFPYPEAEVELNMQGQNIEIEPVEISVLPMMPPLPELETATQLTELIQGLDQLETALQRLAGAASALLQGQTELAGGGVELFAGLAQVAQGLQSTQAGADALAIGLEQLSTSHAQLAESSQLLTAVGDPRLAAIASAIVAEQQALQQLSQSGQQLASGLSASNAALAQIGAQFGSISGGIEQISVGQNALASGLEALRSEGIVPMRVQALAQYEAVEVGLATKQEMQELVAEQHSFIDNENNTSGKVQYLLRTEGIRLPVMPKEVIVPVAKLTLWQRIVNFFRGKRC